MTSLVLNNWAQVAKWLELLTSDHKVMALIPTGGENQLITVLYGALLHRAFHYQPSIVSIWLKGLLKGL